MVMRKRLSLLIFSISGELIMIVLTFATGSSTFLDLIRELARTGVLATADAALAVGVDVTSVMLYYLTI